MLIMYSRFWQDGIEKLENYTEPVKDEKTGHYFFDDFRIALHPHYNKVDNCSGVGVLSFAPNGLIWGQQGVYCYEFNRFGSLYYAIDQILEEVDKSKAKNLTIFVGDKEFVKAFQYLNPYKEEAYNKVHASVIEKLKKYAKCQVLFRDKYPNDVNDRLEKEAVKAAETPQLDNRGHWHNQTGIIYFNIKEQTEDEKKEFARQYAEIVYDITNSVMNEYKLEVGEEKFQQFLADMKAGKVKGLPETKRMKEKKERFVKVKKYPPIKKQILCQNCQSEMKLEKCLRKYPGKQLHYYYRCEKCRATKELNESGRVLVYGKYPRVKN